MSHPKLFSLSFLFHSKISHITKAHVVSKLTHLFGYSTLPAERVLLTLNVQDYVMIISEHPVSFGTIGCHVPCCTSNTADGSYLLILCCAGGNSSKEWGAQMVGFCSVFVWFCHTKALFTRERSRVKT